MIMNDENFIDNVGGLTVRLEPDHVSWFDFLWFSRNTRAKNGGWNSKTHWWEKGVLKLAGDTTGFVAKWTRRSLESQKNNRYLPPLRTGEFKFIRSDTEERGDLIKSLNKRVYPFQDATENELSFALYKEGLGKFERLDFVNLLGYEIPLSSESDGQLKVDLFGLSTDGGALEIIEIKKAKNQGDSPLLALTEAICYALQTLRCEESLLKETQLANHEDAFKRINVTLLAPASYWNYWDPASDVESALKVIVEQVNAGIADDNFDSKLELKLGKIEPMAPGPAA